MAVEHDDLWRARHQSGHGPIDAKAWQARKLRDASFTSTRGFLTIQRDNGTFKGQFTVNTYSRSGGSAHRII
jgi:hypothetical protein